MGQIAVALLPVLEIVCLACVGIVFSGVVPCYYLRVVCGCLGQFLGT